MTTIFNEEIVKRINELIADGVDKYGAFDTAVIETMQKQIDDMDSLGKAMTRLETASLRTDGKFKILLASTEVISQLFDETGE